MSSRPKGALAMPEIRIFWSSAVPAAAKTRFFVKPKPAPVPFLLCGHRSERYDIMRSSPAERKGHRIKSLNSSTSRSPCGTTPLAYIRSEKDIFKLVNAIILNTKGEGEKSGEDFWVKAEKLYYTALIGYIWYEAA